MARAELESSGKLRSDQAPAPAGVVNLVGQTAAITSKVLVLAAEPGIWHVLVYDVCTATGTGTTSCFVRWTDNVGAKSATTTRTLTSTAATNSTIVIQVASGNITFDTTYTATGTYALYIRAVRQ